MTLIQAIPLLVVFFGVIGIAIWGLTIGIKPGLTPEEQDLIIRDRIKGKN